MIEENVRQEYRLEYDQRLPGYSGELPEHWTHKAEVYPSRYRASQGLDRLNAYIEQQAEWYTGDWVRDVQPIRVRDVTYSEWRVEDEQHATQAPAN
jgi:hypothetical protein